MKQIVVILSCFFLTGNTYAQNVGDYRSRSTGNWGAPLVWQVFYNGAWRNLYESVAGPYMNIVPTNNSGKITIRNPNTIRVGSSTTANQLVVENGAQLTIYAPNVLTLVEDFTSTPLLLPAGGYLLVNGTLDLSQLTTTPCQIDGLVQSTGSILSPNPSLLLFNSGSTYKHHNDTGGNIPVAAWDINSNCMISGLQNSNPLPPNNLGQSFGNFIWNTTAMGVSTVTTFSLNGALKTVNGNLGFISTGTNQRVVRLANGGAGYDLSVGGNVEIQGGLVTLSQNQNSTTSISVKGDLIISGGSLTLGTSNNSAVNLFLSGILQKTGGTLTRGSGTGAFTIFSNDQASQ